MMKTRFLTGLLTLSLCCALGTGMAEQAPATVFFGSYPQESDDPEPIEWLMLSEEDGGTLLLSRYALTSLPWHHERTAVTWDESDIRAWLNGEFLESAFSAEEQSALLLTELENGDEYGYGTPAGEPTRDRVFLLSVSEMQTWLTESLRPVTATRYAVSQGAYTNGAGQCAWWLRSPGMTETSPAYLASAGALGSRAHEVNETIIGVRPAIRLSLMPGKEPEEANEEAE